MRAKVLLIDDHHENQKLVVYLLETLGHHVQTASTGEAGVSMACQDSFDLIISDIHLPGIDGYEVARQLKRNPQWHRAPLIAVTAMAMVGDRDKVLASGFEGYLSKPITPRTFGQQIEAFLVPIVTAPAAVPDEPPESSEIPRHSLVKEHTL